MAFGKLKQKNELKKRKQENKTQQEITQRNRESSAKLMAALRLAKASVSGIPTSDGRRVFGNVTDTFISFLDNSPVIGKFDVAPLDQIFGEMIEIYSEALKNGDVETAKHGVERIHGGLVEFRKELNLEEVDQADKVIDERVEKLSQYKEILVLSSRVFINRKNVEDKEKEYIEYMESYKELFKTIEKQTKKRPDLYQFLQDFRPGIDEMDPEAAEMSCNIQKLTKLADQVDDLKCTMELFKAQYNKQMSSLNSLKTILSIKNGLLSAEDMEILNRAVEFYRKHLEETIKESEELREILDTKHQVTSNVFNSVSFGKDVVETVRGYKKLKHKQEIRQEGIKAGLRQKQENEKQKPTIITN